VPRFALISGQFMIASRLIASESNSRIHVTTNDARASAHELSAHLRRDRTDAAHRKTLVRFELQIEDAGT
jgi:hypothetical protein